MITKMRNYDLVDVKNGLRNYLHKASEDESVRQLAINIVGKGTDPIAAIFDWVKENVRYVPDPIGESGDETELIISPIKMVSMYSEGNSIAGDCDDIALLTASLYRSIGIPANITIMDTKGEGYDHAVCKVYSDKLSEWLTVDASSRYPLGWEESYIKSSIID